MQVTERKDNNKNGEEFVCLCNKNSQKVKKTLLKLCN